MFLDFRFSLNAGNKDQKKLCIQTLFTWLNAAEYWVALNKWEHWDKMFKILFHCNKNVENKHLCNSKKTVTNLHVQEKD